MKKFKNQYELEVKTDKKCRILKKLSNKANNSYTYTGSYKKCSYIQRKLAKKGIDSKVYKKQYSRSSSYRNKFFIETNNKKSYRCVYCGKTFPRKRITVDHIVPVSLTKRSKLARLLLKIRGCSGVNDIKNLVPSCYSCNNNKSDELNLKYMFLSRVGNYRFYWIIRLIVQISILILVMYLLLNNTSVLKLIKHNLSLIYKYLIQILSKYLMPIKQLKISK